MHHQTLLRDLGLLPINRVTAAQGQPQDPAPCRTTRREERPRRRQDHHHRRPAPSRITLYARGGALGLGELTDTGNLTFTELARVRTHRNTDKNGYRWYNDYRLPDRLGAGPSPSGSTATRRKARKFNRTENLRPIPANRPRLRTALPATQRRRIDKPGPRRHPLAPASPQDGHDRQHLNLLTYALSVNGLALHRHQRHRSRARRVARLERTTEPPPSADFGARRTTLDSACRTADQASDSRTRHRSTPRRRARQVTRFSARYSPTPALVAQMDRALDF